MTRMEVDGCEDNVVPESPILFSTTEEMGKFIMDELRVKLLELIEEGLLINEKKTKVLILSGTHGDNRTGHSGLTDINMLRSPGDNKECTRTNMFYTNDSQTVGVKSIRHKDLPVPEDLPCPEESIPDIMQVERLDPEVFTDTFVAEEDFSDITFQVVNIAFYHNHGARLVDDIKRFDPKVLALAWCDGHIYGDVARALRKDKKFAKMVMEYDRGEIHQRTNKRRPIL